MLFRSPAVSNRLRLLRLEPEVREAIVEYGLSERHARALLRVGEPREQAELLRRVIQAHMTVSETEALVDEYLSAKRQTTLPDYYVKDIKPFLNTVSGGVRTLNNSGIHTVLTQTDTEYYTILTVKIRRG